MSFATVNGHRLYFEDSGGSGLAIVFSHGFLLDHTIWDAQVAELRGERRCLTYDERGHGASECHAPYTFWELADDAVALLDAVGIERAVLVGHSQGGWLSMCAALAHPSRVAGLVLVDTAADLDEPEVTAGYRAWAQAWTTAGPKGEMLEQLLALQFGLDRDLHRRAWEAKWRGRAPAAYRHVWASVLDGREDVLPRLAEIRCPALVIHGTADVAFATARAHAICAGLPDCRGVVEIEGAPHAPSVTHARRVSDAISAFMAEAAAIAAS